MPRKLEVEVIADADKYRRGLDQAAQSTGNFGSKLGGMAKMAGLAAGGAALGGLVVGLKSSIDAAKEAEKAQARLEQALDSAGVSYKTHGAAIDEAIQKTSRLAALDDEDLSDSFAKLVRSSGDVKGALDGMSLAADIARARNISLEAATKMVEKAQAGNEAAFTRVGIKLKESQDATDALRIAQERFGGAAEKYGNTAAGAQERLGVAFENLQETIGAKLLPVFADLMVKLNEAVVWVQEHWPQIEAEFNRGMDKAKEIFDRIKPILKTITDQIEIVVKLIKAIVDGDWSEVWNQLKAAAVNAVKLIGELIKLEFAVLKGVLKTLGEKALEGLREGAKGLANVILDEIKALPGQIAALGVLLYKAAKNLGGKVLDGVVDGVKGAGAAIGGAIGDGIKGAINFLIDRINAAINFDLKIPGIGPVGGKTIHIGYTIPHLAKGGIVTGPTIALLGDNPGGREAVVPLSGPNARDIGGPTEIVNHIVVELDGQQIYTAVQRQALRYEIANGTNGLSRR